MRQTTKRSHYCPGIPAAQCGSTDPCDACPSNSICETGPTPRTLPGESETYCVSCECGFFDQYGDNCCSKNAAGNNCVPNNDPDANNDAKCTPKSFGGIPSISGAGTSSVCQGNEIFENSAESCLMAPVNQDCICYPSNGALCKESPNDTKVVCRSDDLVLNGSTSVNPECDDCRECMSNACLADGLTAGDFTTLQDVEDTLEGWDGEDCRGNACASVCAYDPN